MLEKRCFKNSYPGLDNQMGSSYSEYSRSSAGKLAAVLQVEKDYEGNLMARHKIHKHIHHSLNL